VSAVIVIGGSSPTGSTLVAKLLAAGRAARLVADDEDVDSAARGARAVVVIDDADPGGTGGHGVRELLDALAGGLAHVVLVSHEPDRSGETVLRESSMPYTIVRPGNLTDGAGGGALRLEQGDREAGSVACEDVAEVCAQALEHVEARGKTFELYGAGDGEPPANWARAFAALPSDQRRRAAGEPV
jgi:uncharacterized protein YbjT (DUF2867 family)